MKPTQILLPILAAALLSLPVTGFAQQATSFEQLQVLVKTGDDIDVSESNGKITKGKIAELSPSLLRLSTKAGDRRFAQSDVLEIKQRRPDSLANGAKWGMIAGFATGGTLLLVGCQIEGGGCESVAAALALGVFTGLGAGIGVGVDALRSGRQTIYKGASRSSLQFAPIITASRKGIAASWSF